MTSELRPCLRCLTRIQVHKAARKWLLTAMKLRCSSSDCHYKTLDVPKSASQDDIKRSFFEKSKKYHPDVSPGKPNHHQIFVKLNNAYGVLSNISKRKEYDRNLLQRSPVYNNYQSHENIYKYDQSFYYERSSRQEYSDHFAKKRSTNMKIAIGLVFITCFGVSLRLLWIGYRHHHHKVMLDQHSRTASKLYQEARERSSKNGMKKQLEILVERQGKTKTRRHPEE